MNYSKRSFILCLLFSSSLAICADSADTKAASDALAKKMDHQKKILSAMANSATDAIIPWPYQLDFTNCGPSSYNGSYFLKWTGHHLQTCEWGTGPARKEIYFDMGTTPIWIRSNWQAALSPDSKRAAVCAYGGFAESGEAVDVSICSLAENERKIVETFEIKWPGSWSGRKDNIIGVATPSIIFDAQNQLHYAEKGENGFDLVNHDTKERTSIATSAFFLSLIKQKEKITAAFTYDTDYNVWIYNQYTRSFLLPLQGHTEPVVRVNTHPNDASRIISSSFTNTRLWDLSTGTCLRSFKAISSNVLGDHTPCLTTDCCFAGDNSEYIVGFGFDGVNVWDTRSSNDTPAYHFFPGRAFQNGCAQGRLIAAGGGNQEQFWIPKEKSNTEQTSETIPANTKQTNPTNSLYQLQEADKASATQKAGWLSWLRGQK